MSSPIPYEFDDHDIVSPGYSVALVARYPLARLGRQFAPVDADDCAPAWVTDFDRSHPYAMACIARQGDDSHDLPWDEVVYDMDWCGRFCEDPTIDLLQPVAPMVQL